MSGLIYSFVAREGTVLAEYSALAGNFRAVAVECLQNSQITDDKFTVTADAYTFNYLVHAGYTFLVVADEAYGRQIPFAFLERLRDAFVEKSADRARTAPENSLNSSFGPTIKRQMEYCRDHPEEISKMVSVQRKVDEVKGIMMQNVEQVLVRGERLDVLVDRTDDLRDQAAKFQRQGTQLRKKMWWQNFRMQIIVVGVVVLLAVVIFLLACFTGGKNCVSKGHSGSSSSSPAPGNNFAATPGAPAGFAPSSLSPGESSSSGTGGSPAGGFAPTPGAPAGMAPSTLSPGEPQTVPGKRLL